MPVRIEELLSHRAWVTALACALVRDANTADDLVQDTYATALTRPPDRRTSLRGWLATVLRNRLRDRYRMESRRARREELAARSESAPSAADLAAAADAHRQVMEAVVALEEPYREAVLLRYYEGVSMTEVAERQGVPPSTARTRLKRARDRLRDRLDGEHGRDGRTWALALVPLITRTPEPGGPRPVGAAGGLGAFLMAHKVKLVAAGLTALVCVSMIVSAGGPADPVAPSPPSDPGLLAGVPAPGPGPENEDAAGGAGAAANKTPFRLPATSRADAVALPIADTTVIALGRDGRLAIGDTKGNLEGEGVRRLLVPLTLFAEKNRDVSHPMQPSKNGVVLRADALTPWQTVRRALWLPGDPDVRMSRVYWAAMRGETEVGLPVFLPKDRGLAMTKMQLGERLRVRVRLTCGAGRPGPAVRLLDRDLGEGEAGLASLEAELPALLARAPGAPALIEVDGEVPFEHVIRVLDLVPKPNSGHLADLYANGTEVRLTAAPSEPVTGTVEDLERRFVPKKEDLARFRELVAMQEFSPSALRDLLEMIRPSRALAVALGRAYAGRGEPLDLLRAVTLAALAARGDPARRYDRTWWEAETLLQRAILAYAAKTKDVREVEMALARSGALSDLGLLGRSPYRGEILRIRGDLEALADEMK